MAISRNMMERQLRAGGGLMTLEEPRQGYFLGKIVRKAKKAVKKVVKSPIGKAALAAAAIKFGGPAISKLFAGGGGGGIGSLFSRFGGGKGMLGQLGNIFKVGGEAGNPLSIFRVGGGLAGLGATLAPFFMGGPEEEVDDSVDVTGVQPMVQNIRDQAKTFYTDPASRADAGLYFMPREEFVRPFAGGGLADIPRGGYGEGESVISKQQAAMIKQMKEKGMDIDTIATMTELTKNQVNNFLSSLNSKAEGGIMDLGGMEKDYREGGFVPIGAEERADDVPARLSKNEFVFTADAVRAAGQGDIDKGAEVMQNMMDNLEAGGTISEESQGMENPAQAMFDQAQMLEGRLE